MIRESISTPTFFLIISSELFSFSSDGARNFPSTFSNCSSVSAEPIRKKTRSTSTGKKYQAMKQFKDTKQSSIVLAH